MITFQQTCYSAYKRQDAADGIPTYSLVGYFTSAVDAQLAADRHSTTINSGDGGKIRWETVSVTIFENMEEYNTHTKQSTLAELLAKLSNAERVMLADHFFGRS